MYSPETCLFVSYEVLMGIDLNAWRSYTTAKDSVISVEKKRELWAEILKRPAIAKFIKLVDDARENNYEIGRAHV